MEDDARHEKRAREGEDGLDACALGREKEEVGNDACDAGDVQVSVQRLVEAWTQWDGASTSAEAMANELETLVKIHASSKRRGAMQRTNQAAVRQGETWEKRLADVVLRLEAHAEGLQASVYEADLPFRGSTCSALDSEAKIKAVVSYAHRTSYSTFAPVGYDSGRCGNVGYFRPAPQAEQLVASRLHQQKHASVGDVEASTTPAAAHTSAGATSSPSPRLVSPSHVADVRPSSPQLPRARADEPSPSAFRMDLNPDIEVLDDYVSPSDTSDESD